MQKFAILHWQQPGHISLSAWIIVSLVTNSILTNSPLFYGLQGCPWHWFWWLLVDNYFTWMKEVSVDFSPPRIIVKMRFQQTHNQGLCPIFLGPPRLAEHTWRLSLFLCNVQSSRSNVQSWSRANEGHSVSSKSPSKAWDRDKEVAGMNRREK